MCGVWCHSISRVVPAKAGTHTPRLIAEAMELFAFAKFAPVLMGPGVRRDDGQNLPA